MDSLAGLRAEVIAAISRAVAWWLAELAALIPRRFSRRGGNAPATLDVSANQAALLLAGRGAVQPLRIPLGGDDQQHDRTRVQAALRQRPARSVIIRLDPSLIFETSVTLPIAAEQSLRPILLNQLERLVPLPPDAVEFQFLVTERSPAAKTIGVKLIVATRACIDRAVNLVRSVGLDPSEVIAASGLTGEDSEVTLWQARDDQVVSPAMRRVRRTLEVAAILLFVGAYATYVYRLNDYRDQLQQDVDVAAKAAAAARDLIARNQQTESALALLLRRQREMDPLTLLDELTKLVPDDTWISQLTVRGRGVELIGYSPRVRDLISRIQDHDIFYDPKFLSPITLSADGKGERFDVSFDVWIEGAP